MEMLDQLKEVEDQLEDALNELDKYKQLYQNCKNMIYHSDAKDKIDQALG